MSKISLMMDTGKRSMMNSQTALQTVGHNIANKSTEGYSRQRVELQSNVPIGEGNLRIGTGSRAAQVTRINNPYVEKQLQRESSTASFLSSKSDAMARVEQVYNEQLNKGLNQYVTEFFNAYRELSNYPESTATRTLVRESADALTKDFNRVSNQLTSVQEDLETQLKVHVEEINQMTKELASLNEKVQSVELQGMPANDERDRRDVILKKLNEKVDITWAEGDNGLVTVTAGKTGVLVSGYEAYELKAGHGPDTERLQIYFQSPAGTLTNITKRISGGAMGGALEIRDQTIEEFKDRVDEVAYTLALEVNRAHVQGYDLNGRKGSLIFAMPEQVKGAAKNIQLGKLIQEDVTRIVSGLRPGAAADNTVANVISSLQNKPLMQGGTATIDDFYNSQVGQVGILAQRANKAADAQKNIVEQISKIRESVSGVSLDEEATKMIEYQKSFDASARLIKTADEMLETVLNLKRL